MMEIVARTAKSDIATVFIANFGDDRLIEFVESTQPPIPIDQKWVLIISTMFGCPVGCKFCDSGWHYDGKMDKEQLFAQIEYLIKLRYPNMKVPVKKFKIQFARMGEPALNSAVLDVLDEFPSRIDAPGFLPSVSSIAPHGCDDFFERLLEIKNKHYQGNFQLQFSIHTTDIGQRDQLLPVRKWSFDKIADYGRRFRTKGDKKITLNFAMCQGYEISTETLLHYFSPEHFIIKLTPVNPTSASKQNNIASSFFSNSFVINTVKDLKFAGYEVLLSLGEVEENKIGSNCGQFITNFLKQNETVPSAYTYPIENLI